jgi:hypothetical protein
MRHHVVLEIHAKISGEAFVSIFRLKEPPKNVGNYLPNYTTSIQEDSNHLSFWKSSVFGIMKPFCLLKVNRRFGGTRCIHLQGWRTNKERNQHETASRAIMLVFFSLFFYSTLKERQLTVNGLYGVTSKETELVKTLRTSDPALIHVVGGQLNIVHRQLIFVGQKLCIHHNSVP